MKKSILILGVITLLFSILSLINNNDVEATSYKTHASDTLSKIALEHKTILNKLKEKKDFQKNIIFEAQEEFSISELTIDEDKIHTNNKENSNQKDASAPVKIEKDGMNWFALAECESSGNKKAVDPSGTYHGLYQFDEKTWHSVGGSGLASEASEKEQTMRAQMLYAQRGHSPWPVCGNNL